MPLSHDEVVYGKGSLLAKMPGDDWQKFANLRLLLAYLYCQPGKKLLFMGGELAPVARVEPRRVSLDWHLLDEPRHRQIQLLVGELNRLYRSEPRAARARLRAARASSGSTPTTPSAVLLVYERAGGTSERDHLRAQLHAGAAPQLSASA